MIVILIDKLITVMESKNNVDLYFSVISKTRKKHRRTRVDCGLSILPSVY